MNPKSDLEINRDIRRIMVRHWIDLGRVSVRSSKGRVMVVGLLIRISGVRDKLSAAVVENIFDEIKRLDGVNRISIDLKNWSQGDGGWREIEQVIKSSAKTAGAHATAGTGTYDIIEEQG